MPKLIDLLSEEIQKQLKELKDKQRADEAKGRRNEELIKEVNKQ